MSRKRPPKRIDTETCPLTSRERWALLTRTMDASGRVKYSHLPDAGVTPALRARLEEDRAELRRYGIVLQRGPEQTPWHQVVAWAEGGER